MNRGWSTETGRLDRSLLRSPEERFCAGLISTRIGCDGAAAGYRLPAEDKGRLDWACVRQLAETHRVAPLLAAALANGSRWAVDVPDSVRSSFVGARRRTAYQNHRRVLWCRNAQQLMERAGVECLWTQGMAILAAQNGDPSLRPMVDADLWVRPEQRQRAMRVLQDQRWQRRLNVHERSFWQRGRARDASFSVPGEPTSRIDLHWRLTPLNNANTIDLPEQVWRRARTVDWHGTGWRIPAPEDLLACVMLHHQHHGFDTWLRVADFVQLASVNDMPPSWGLTDWPADANLRGACAFLLWQTEALMTFRETGLPFLRCASLVTGSGVHVVGVMDGGRLPHWRLVHNQLAGALRQLAAMNEAAMRRRFVRDALFPEVRWVLHERSDRARILVRLHSTCRLSRLRTILEFLTVLCRE